MSKVYHEDWDINVIDNTSINSVAEANLFIRGFPNSTAEEITKRLWKIGPLITCSIHYEEKDKNTSVLCSFKNKRDAEFLLHDKRNCEKDAVFGTRLETCLLDEENLIVKKEIKMSKEECEQFFGKNYKTEGKFIKGRFGKNLRF